MTGAAAERVGRVPLWRHLLVSVVMTFVWVLLSGIFIALPPFSAILYLLALLLLFWVRNLRRRDDPNSRQAEVFARLRPPPAGAWGPLAIATIFILAYVGSVVVLAARFLEMDDLPSFEFLFQYAARPGGRMAVLLAVGVLAPVIEEVGFRGWIQRPLEERIGSWVAIATTAALFGLAHAPSHVLLFGYFVIWGLVLGWAVRLTGSIWAGIGLHAAGNLVMMLVSFAGLDPAVLAGDPAGVTTAAAVLALAVGGLAALGLGFHKRAGSRADRWNRRHAGPALGPAFGELQAEELRGADRRRDVEEL